jgi:glycosyltransferase involved in cell wall biosynthesis
MCVEMNLTIIIPVYNGEKYLNDCLNSIMRKINSNNRKDIELIIINDGSTDGTMNILGKYNNCYIKIYNNLNYGVSHSRNFGIEKACGKYITFVDADDLLKENWIEVIDKCLSDNFDIIYINKKINKNIKYDTLIEYIIGNDGVYLSGPYCKLYRRDFLLENNIKFNESIINGEDMLFNINCFINLKSFRVENDSFYLYRQNVGSSTKRFNENIVESDTNFHNNLHELLRKSKLREDTILRLENKCKMNAILTIIDRISYINKYKNAKEKFIFLEKYPYNEIIKLNTSNMGKKVEVIFYLCKIKKYKLLFSIMKIKNKLKRANKNKDNFIEI